MAGDPCKHSLPWQKSSCSVRPHSSYITRCLLILKWFRSKHFTKVKLPPVAGLSSDLERFLDHKWYHLENVIYMWIMVGVPAVCETMEILVVKYYAENLKNNMSFLIWFLNDDVDSLLYLAMMNVYLALIVKFVLHLTTVSNRKLHTAAFWKILRLVPTFLLLLF